MSPVTAGAPRCPSGAQVVPGHQDPEYRSTHQLIDLSSFEALSGNTLQQLANEKLTASWQISLGFHDFHGKAHTINCFLYWIWNELYMDFIAGKLVARSLSGRVCCVHVGHCHLFGNNLCCKQRNCSPHSNYYSRCENDRATWKQRLYQNPKQLSTVFDII